MLTDATVLVRIPLADNVSLASEPAARSVVVRRGIPTTLNTPSLDPVLMYDGRHGSLESQARAAIVDHAQGTAAPTAKELEQIAVFERTRPFFSSNELWNFAFTGRAPRATPRPDGIGEARPRLLRGRAARPGQFQGGLCAVCHSGPMLNETNEFFPAPPFDRGGRFQSVLRLRAQRGRQPDASISCSRTRMGRRRWCRAPIRGGR